MPVIVLAQNLVGVHDGPVVVLKDVDAVNWRGRKVHKALRLEGCRVHGVHADSFRCLPGEGLVLIRRYRTA